MPPPFSCFGSHRDHAHPGDWQLSTVPSQPVGFAVFSTFSTITSAARAKSVVSLIPHHAAGQQKHSQAIAGAISVFRRGLSVTLIVLSAGPIAAARGQEKTSTEVALAFWNAFLDANPDEMGKYYAPRVTLKAGSELLKSEYTINDSGDRGKDVTVDRKVVIRGYRVMFARVGKEKWIESSRKLRNVQMSFISAADNNKYFAMFKASPGELLVQIHTQPEPLFFLLQQDGARNWQVVAEAFD
jgi:hypothetical protein